MTGQPNQLELHQAEPPTSPDTLLAHWGVPVCLMLLSLGLRVIGLENVQVEHFDEGVYASGYFADHLGNRYPDEHLYSPPLFPALVRWVLYLAQGNPHCVVWVNVLIGTLLTGVIWRVTQDWFNPAAALMAGLLSATNEFAIYYSRAVLTDTLLCLWLILALWCSGPAITRGGWGRILLAAVLSALAWWTKYNGWLSLAISGVATFGWLLRDRPARDVTRAALLRWGAIAGLTLLLWSPVVWQLQPHGGYQAVAANHAGYFGGLSGWFERAWLQVAMERAFTSYYSWGLTSLGLGLGLFILKFSDLRRESLIWRLARPLFPMAVCLFLGNLLTLCLVLLTYLYALAFGKHREESAERRWGVIAVAVWCLSLIVAVPMYRAYPRLQLPLLTALLVFGGAAVSHWVKSHQIHGTRLAIQAVVGLSMFWQLFPDWQAVHLPLKFHRVFEPRSGFAQSAPMLVDRLRQPLAAAPASTIPGIDCAVYVLGEPGLYYHLASREDLGPIRYITQPAGNLGMLAPRQPPGLPTFLVTSRHAHRDHPELLENPPPQLVPVAEFDYQPSRLVRQDDITEPEKSPRENSIRLWYIKPEVNQ